MSYMERTKEKTQYGMKEEVDKANEMVKQVTTTENDKDNVVSALHWKQLSDTRMFLCS
jgi:hypothetical protein